MFVVVISIVVVVELCGDGFRCFALHVHLPLLLFY